MSIPPKSPEFQPQKNTNHQLMHTGCFTRTAYKDLKPPGVRRLGHGIATLHYHDRICHHIMTLQRTNISHLWKTNMIFNNYCLFRGIWDMSIPRKVLRLCVTTPNVSCARLSSYIWVVNILTSWDRNNNACPPCIQPQHQQPTTNNQISLSSF